MCYYKLFIFQGCGHSIPSTLPIRPCATAVVIEREKWEGMRKAAEEKTKRRRSQGLRAKRYSTDDDVPSSSQVEPHTVPVESNAAAAAAAAQHSTSTPTSQGIPPQTPQPRPETRQPWNDGEGIPPSETTPTLTSRTHITRIGSEPSSTPGTAIPAAHVGSAAGAPSPCGTVQTHPFQTVKIYRSCARCTRNREELLAQSESAQPKVHFDDWRWKVRYLGPIPEESRSPGGMSSGSSVDWSQGVGELMGSWVKPWKPMKTVQSLGGMLINPLPPLLSSPPPTVSQRSRTHVKSRSDSEAMPIASDVSDDGPSRKSAKAHSADLGRMGSRGGWPSS